jgi:iron-sulfur cluster insertion protein
MDLARDGRDNPHMQANIDFSDKAAAKVKALITADGDEALRLRVFVTGGGCNGFSYGFTFDEDVAEDDAVVDRQGVSMVVDAMSYPYLDGSVVDYIEDLNGSQFIVTNPNAASTCGCGNSFSI